MPTSIQNASDAELIIIATQCREVLNNDPGDYPGVTAPMILDLGTFLGTFQGGVTLNASNQAAASASIQQKDVARVPLEAQISTIRNIAKANHTTEAAMAALGIPQGSSPAPANATRPIGRVDTGQRLQHTISWTDEATPDNKKKPRGTMGAEIYCKLDGPPPTDPSECTFVAIDSATPYLITYAGGDAGKMAHYMLRWRMSDGHHRPLERNPQLHHHRLAVNEKGFVRPTEAFFCIGIGIAIYNVGVYISQYLIL